MDDAPTQGSPRPISTRQDATAVLKRLREAGHVAYFAGGCVRDELLGLKPKDYDVATDAPPPKVRTIFPNTQAVGAKFGVILVRLGESQIEVATFRKEGKYEDGRHPSEVTFTTAQEDAKRRDFTINGMFFDPIENKVIDFVGGQEDLKKKVLRAIGDPNHRFDEDHLRILRAIRFGSRFDLQIEPETARAIRKHARDLTRISPERIAEELRLIFAAPTGTRSWHALSREFPEIAQVIFRFAGVSATDQPPVDGSGIVDSLAELRLPFGVWLAAMSIDWSMTRLRASSVTSSFMPQEIRRMVRAVRQSLRISNDEAETMQGTLEGVSILLKHVPLPVAVAKRFLARDTARWSRELLDALKCQVGAMPVEAIQKELDAYARTDYAPAPIITGDDLTAHGLTPGPLFKRILNEVYDAQLELRIATKAEAMELAMKLAK